MKESRIPMILAAILVAISCQSTNRNFETTDTSKKAVEIVNSHQEVKEELEDLVLRINSDISSGRYEKWLSYLSSDYIDNYNSSEVLSEIGHFPRLRTRGIVLTDLKSYYKWVVVPSRYDVKLDVIEVTTEKRAIAYSTHKGSKARLYELEKIHGKWRITIWK